tara:strand:- start:142 stop:516 length:375 start_codon:yes stop_codon:yes gene_type:complete
MNEKFVSLGYVLEYYKNYNAVLEYRPEKYMFGTNNYGEIVGLKNRADGDRWDIFIPGYNFKLEIGKETKIMKIIGFLYLNNGNHKIAIRVNEKGFNKQMCQAEIAEYTQTYLYKNRKKGMFIYI